MRKTHGVALLTVCSLLWPLAPASAQSIQPTGICPSTGAGTLQALESRIACLEKILQYVRVIDQPGTDINSLAYPQVIITGANVLIQSGSRLATDDRDTQGKPSGLGNLVVGYNETPSGLQTQERHGSHNLIVGSQHRYDSVGGVVAGLRNTISGYFTTVSGGRDNYAEGYYTSVSGGLMNHSKDFLSSISGGYNNSASGGRWCGPDAICDGAASVSGGGGNVVNGPFSSISGGYANTASGPFTSVSGGGGNVATGPKASVSGGQINHADGEFTSVSGGYNHVAGGTYASISGGYANTASGAFASVSGGGGNVAAGNASVSGSVRKAVLTMKGLAVDATTGDEPNEEEVYLLVTARRNDGLIV